MTDEEYERARQLEQEINALIAENNRLRQEISLAVDNVYILSGNVNKMSGEVIKSMTGLNETTDVADENVAEVRRALEDLTAKYFQFKELSTASKNLTQLTDEYFTKFKYYNKLRRITLGYVIGLDNAIISNETLRKEVEKIYLQNTEYWLAYAIAAVMLWVSDEKSAAVRAVRKAISIDACKADVFFLLVNLRFERLETAKDWYLDYLDKVDLTALGNEYQYLLQAYLAGLFGHDAEFEKYVSDNFEKSLVRIDAVTVDFANKFTKRAKDYANTYLHTTELEFPTLYEVSSDYENLKKLLSKAECNEIFAQKYLDLAQYEEEYPENHAERIEKVLYDLINAYDDSEWKIIKAQKYNEAIMAAHGDRDAADKNYQLQYADIDKKRSLAELMLDWAFSDDPLITNIVIKRFTISLMKEAISKGYEQFAEEYRKEEPESIKVEIDGYTLECNESNYEQQSEKLAANYTKDRFKNSFKDKYVLIFTLICIASVLTLVITAFSFSPVALTIGILGGIVGGFVLWRRLVEVGRILEEKKRLGIAKLKMAVEELKNWRDSFHKADKHSEDVKQIFEQF